MSRVIVFHYDAVFREQIADFLRGTGDVVFAAEDAQAAWVATNALRPDVVVTDFPAYVPTGDGRARTLTEAIRSEPDLANVAILNLRDHMTARVRDYALQAGVTLSLPRSMPLPQIVNTIHELNAGRAATW